MKIYFANALWIISVSAFAQPSFRPATTYNSDYSFSTVTGDFNGDGKTDIVGVGFDGHFTVMLGNGDGTFPTSPPTYPLNSGTLGKLFSNDIDGDGDLDISLLGVGFIEFYKNNGAGVLSYFNTIVDGTPGFPNIAAPGFLNSDNKIDFAFFLYNGTDVQVHAYLGDGTGAFTLAATPTDPVTPLAPLSVVNYGTSADFDLDGDSDVLIYGTNGIQLFLNEWDGAKFKFTPSLVTADPTENLVIADFNGGSPEFATAFSTTQLAAIYSFHSATSTFSTIGSQTTGSFPGAITASDFNGDGFLDIAVGYQGASTISVALGNGTGALAPMTDFPVGITPGDGMTSGNFNGDARQDICVGGNTSSVIMIANNPPTDISITSSSVDENVAANTTVGTLSTTDPDAGDIFTYSLVSGPGSGDNTSFNINGNSLRVSVTPDYETKGSYSIRVRTADQAGLLFEKVLTITVNDINEAPTDIFPVTNTVNENVPVNTMLGTFITSDQDFGEDPVYTLVTGVGSTDNASFNINGPNLLLSVSPDFEVKNSYSIRVRSTDHGGLYYEKTFTIAINDVNEAPTNISLSPYAINENAAINTTVGTLSSTDPDVGGTFTYALANGTGDTDNASFTISGGNLQIAVSSDFEIKNSYSVRVRTTDQGGLYYEKAFNVTINDVNETPTSISLSSASIDESVAINTVVGTLSSTDPDVGNTFTYALANGAGDTDNASFTISGGNLRINVSPDFEMKNSYSMRVRTTDQGGLFYERIITISINNINETSTDISLSSTNINENVAVNTVVGELSSTDPDVGDTFIYSLAPGIGSSDNYAFNISGNNLRISVSPDYETKNVYSILVRSMDQGGLTYEKIFVININDINEGVNHAPTEISLNQVSVDENVAINTIVGTLTSSDQDAGDTFTYSLVGGVGSEDNGSFNLNGANLLLSVSPDYEAQKLYTIRIHTTDQRNLSFEKIFTVTINDVNEAPTDIVISGMSVDDKAASNTEIGLLTTIDPDADNKFTYMLVPGMGSTDNSSFGIAENGLHILISPNIEEKSSYSIRLRSIDQGGLAIEKIFTVSVLNLAQANSRLFVPNTFSPNDDGVNDIFRIRGITPLKVKVTVFDSSGSEVYSTSDIQQATITGWNGTYNGKVMPTGAYFWVLDAELPEGIIKESGSIILIK